MAQDYIISESNSTLDIPQPFMYNPSLILEDGSRTMPGKRKITGTKPLFGQSRSKAFNTVKRQFKPNLQNKRIYVPELDRWVRVKITRPKRSKNDRQDRLHGIPQAPQHPAQAAAIAEHLGISKLRLRATY